jgi:alpha-ketoglutaric semialdehyde dehydrogenase
VRPLVRRLKLFIDGKLVNSESGETYTRVNPADPDKVIGEFQKGNPEDAKIAVEAAQNALSTWSRVPAKQSA